MTVRGDLNEVLQRLAFIFGCEPQRNSQTSLRYELNISTDPEKLADVSFYLIFKGVPLGLKRNVVLNGVV